MARQFAAVGRYMKIKKKFPPTDFYSYPKKKINAEMLYFYSIGPKIAHRSIRHTKNQRSVALRTYGMVDDVT